MNEKVIMLKDADYVIKDFSNIEKCSSVLIQGNLIVDVDKSEKLEQKYPVADIIDCHGKVVLPGFINCHTHCNETMMRGLGHNLTFPDWCNNMVFPMGKVMEADGEKLYRRIAQITAMEAVASGTTSLIENNVNFGKHHSLTLARGLSDFGIRGAVAMGAEDFSPMDYGHVTTIEAEAKEVQTFLEEWAMERNDLVRAWVGPSGGKRTVGGCTTDLLRELKSLANSFQTHLHMHLVGSRAEFEKVKKETGFPGGVAYLNDLGILDEKTSLVHCVWIAEEEKPILKTTGARIVHCPSSAQCNAMGFLPLMKLLNQGTICALGTDGANPNDSLDMFREMRQAVLLQLIGNMNTAEMSHIDAFRMATEYGAKVLGVENIGKIEKGYLADIVTVRIKNNPFLIPLHDPVESLVYAGSGGRDVAMTIVNGKVIYQDGEFKTLDSEKVISEIQAFSDEIIKSVPFLSGYLKLK